MNRKKLIKYSAMIAVPFIIVFVGTEVLNTMKPKFERIDRICSEHNYSGTVTINGSEIQCDCYSPGTACDHPVLSFDWRIFLGITCIFVAILVILRVPWGDNSK